MPLIIYFVGFVLSRLQAHRLVIFFFIIQFFVLWFVLKFYPSSYSFMGTVNTLTLYTAIAILFFRFSTTVSFYLKIYFSFIVFFFLLVLFQNKFVGGSIGISFSYFRNFFHSFLILPVIIISIKEFQYNGIFKFLTAFYLLISVIYLFQLVLPGIKEFLIVEFILRDGEFIPLVAKQVVEGNPSIGTFIRPANLGNGLALFIPFFFVFYKLRFLKLKSVFFWLLYFLFLFVLISTGIRTSFISLAVFQGGLFLIFYDKRVLIPLSILFILIIFTFFSDQILFYDRSDFSNPILRIFYLFNYFQESNSLLEDSTLIRSSNIFAFYENFWFGSGVYSNGNYLQGISSITDLTLAFIFVEYGVLIFLASLFLFTYPLFFTFKSFGYSLNFKILILLFTSVLLQTVTDQGFFTNYSSYLYFLFTGYLMVNKL